MAAFCASRRRYAISDFMAVSRAVRDHPNREEAKWPTGANAPPLGAQGEARQQPAPDHDPG